MWKLYKVGNSILTQYVQEMLPSLVKRLEANLTIGDVRILIPGYKTTAEDLSVLKGLLTDEPAELLQRNNALMGQLIAGYRENELATYQEAKRKKNNATLVNKYEIKLKELLDAFDYKGALSQNKERAYRLTEMKGTNVCTYCNRQYIFTVNKPKKKGQKHIVRPELDHWFCKELYPLLSLSFYNLIPSCHICNSSVKGSAVFSLATHVHPYVMENANPNIQFKPTVVSGHSSIYGVKIVREKDSKEDNTVKAFALGEIYAEHGRLEVTELMQFNSAYSDGYLKVLFDELLNKYCPKMTRAEVYRMLFGTEFEPEKFGERPMSKLKYDVLKYLHVI